MSVRPPLGVDVNNNPARLRALRLLKLAVPRALAPNGASLLGTTFFNRVRRWAAKNTAEPGTGDEGEVKPIDRDSAVELGFLLYVFSQKNTDMVRTVLEEANASDALKGSVLSGRVPATLVPSSDLVLVVDDSPSRTDGSPPDAIASEIVDEAMRVFYREEDPHLAPLRKVVKFVLPDSSSRTLVAPRGLFASIPQATSVRRALQWMHAPTGVTEDLALALLTQPSLDWYRIPYTKATDSGARSLGKWLNGSLDVYSFVVLQTLDNLYRRLVDEARGDTNRVPLIPATAAGAAAYAGPVSRRSFANLQDLADVLRYQAISAEMQASFDASDQDVVRQLEDRVSEDLRRLTVAFPPGSFHEEILSAVRASHTLTLGNARTESSVRSELYRYLKSRRKNAEDVAKAMGLLQDGTETKNVFNNAWTNLQPFVGRADYAQDIRQSLQVPSSSLIDVFPKDADFLTTPDFGKVVRTMAGAGVNVRVLVGRADTILEPLSWTDSQERARAFLHVYSDDASGKVTARAVYVVWRFETNAAPPFAVMPFDVRPIAISNKSWSETDRAMRNRLWQDLATPQQRRARLQDETPKNIKELANWPDALSNSDSLCWGVWLVHAFAQGLSPRHIVHPLLETMGPQINSYVTRGAYAQKLADLIKSAETPSTT